jgi:PAP2 superfamily protein
MKLLLLFLSPGLIGIAAVFWSVIWMLRNEKDKSRPLLVFALILNLFYGFLLTRVLNREGSLVPWKYDLVLFNLDKTLGIPPASVAMLLQRAWRVPLFIIYQLMVPMMIFWFLIIRDQDRRKSLVTAYVVELVAGPILYAILPACGPVYAFGANWLHPPITQAQVIRFSGMPNAFPSLHMATAFVFVLFAQGKLWRGISLAFLLATALATLATGEHYVIDLAPGLVFGCFATTLGHLRVRQALLPMVVVLAWSFAIRFEYRFLLSAPALVKSMALLTVALAFWTLFKEWTSAVPPVPEPATSVGHLYGATHAESVSEAQTEV